MELQEKNMGPVVWIVIAVAGTVGTVWLAVKALRWAKKGTHGGKTLTAALFPFRDQPPPQEQVERQIRLEKDAESGDRAD